MLDKEDRMKLKEQEREYHQKAKERREELKKLNAEQKKARRDHKKNSKLARPTKKKMQKPSDQKKILSVFPIRDYIDSGDFFITDEHTIINLFQIQGRSYYDASEDDVEDLVLNNEKFLQKYADDFKLIGMNYPTNTKQQQKFLSYMLQRPDLEKYSDMLTEKLQTLKALEQNTTDRQAFLMIFANDKEHYGELLRLLRNNPYFVIRPLGREKRENILFQLNNMCKRIKV